jgi:hypothetical protein
VLFLGSISLERNGLFDTGHFFFFAIQNATIVIMIDSKMN